MSEPMLIKTLHAYCITMGGYLSGVFINGIHSGYRCAKDPYYHNNRHKAIKEHVMIGLEEGLHWPITLFINVSSYIINKVTK